MALKDWYPDYSLRKLNFFSPDINIYSQKQRWKFFLLVAAVSIAFVSSWYTDKLVNKLSEEEKKKVQLWAEGTKQRSIEYGAPSWIEDTGCAAGHRD